MIAALLLLSLVGMATPQRSPYLGQSAEYPGLLPRFRPSAAPASNESGIGDRIGGTQPAVATQYADGTLYDAQTIDRVAQLPREKQPFWYVNRQHLASHRGTSANGTN